MSGVIISSRKHKEKLLDAFPESVHDELGSVLEVIPFSQMDIKFWVGMTYLPSNTIKITLDNRKLELPYRIHLKQPKPKSVEKLTPVQKELLWCIYSRHHDGYVRQKALEKIVGSDNYWATPFKIQLLAEYILPIIELLEATLEDNKESYLRFISENTAYWEVTKQKMVSYWDVYYRNNDRASYPGWKIVNKLSEEL